MKIQTKELKLDLTENFFRDEVVSKAIERWLELRDAAECKKIFLHFAAETEFVIYLAEVPGRLTRFDCTGQAELKNLQESPPACQVWSGRRTVMLSGPAALSIQKRGDVYCIEIH